MKPATKQALVQRLDLVARELQVSLAEAHGLDWTPERHEPASFVGRMQSRLERWAAEVEQARQVLTSERTSARTVREVLVQMPARPDFSRELVPPRPTERMR